MVIAGSWQLCDDGLTRPVLRASIRASDGTLIADDFLIDSGADRTVFSAALMVRLQLPTRNLDSGTALCGVGGQTDSVLVSATVQFLTQAGHPVRIHGEFAAFTDPTATDLSILGRDISDLFDLIISRRQSQILMIAGDHRYRVELGE